jgi:hypothetical protein
MALDAASDLVRGPFGGIILVPRDAPQPRAAFSQSLPNIRAVATPRGAIDGGPMQRGINGLDQNRTTEMGGTDRPRAVPQADTAEFRCAQSRTI